VRHSQSAHSLVELPRSGYVVRTSESHPLYVDFVQTRGERFPGRLGLTFAPGKCHRSPAGDWQRDIYKDLRRLREYWQTDVLVSLIEEHEFHSLQIPTLLDLASAYGITAIWFPIEDQTVPASMIEFSAMIARIKRALTDGQNVVIHCMGGLGRSGLVAAACLVASSKIKPKEAIATVRKARLGAIQTSEQEKYVFSYYEHIRQRGGSTFSQ
jgi:protein-tyrosine phosphatase